MGHVTHTHGIKMKRVKNFGEETWSNQTAWKT